MSTFQWLLVVSMTVNAFSFTNAMIKTQIDNARTVSQSRVISEAPAIGEMQPDDSPRRNTATKTRLVVLRRNPVVAAGKRCRQIPGELLWLVPVPDPAMTLEQARRLA